MAILNLKPNHKPIIAYYAALETFSKHGISHETAVRNAFQTLLVHCCKIVKLDFTEEYTYNRKNRNPLKIDGAFLDKYSVSHGYWEAKDSQDDLAKEVIKKFEIGYPRENIIFQSPERAIIYQGSYAVLDEDITSPNMLVQVLEQLFIYKTDVQLEWETAVEEFKNQIPQSAETLIKLIEEERKYNTRFVTSFDTFTELCRSTINPNISDAAVEEMLVQHLLTERIFRKVFENPDFVNRNIIASEIEQVVQSLTSRKFNRQDFERPLDRFYVALERRAQTLDDYSQKQSFLNTVYEKFFQGYAVKVADTHGIVYTPQPIVNFMVESVDEILKREFGKSLSSKGVHVLDPFTGTGTYKVRILRQINRTDLNYKYLNELHCNEIMLLPYYIASMNIEHEYYDLMGEYLPFPGICLVDTFQLYEGVQSSLFTEENTQRVQKLRETPIFVFISNPPYNAGQVNENDNNKNRKYPHLDKRVSDTYGKDSKATLLRKLQDPYVKAFRYASDEVLKNGEGVVAFITNNSFLDDSSFDGMRKHLEENFDKIFVVDLKGNIRKDSMKDGIPLGEKHTVFGLGAMVGISITFLIKKPGIIDKKIFYSKVDFRSTRMEKFSFIERAKNIYGLPSKQLIPDYNYTWLTEGMQEDFESLLPLGTKEAKAGTDDKAIFKLYSLGVSTNRDAWVYNSNLLTLIVNIKQTIESYNNQVFKYSRLNPKPLTDDFIDNDDSKISWSRDLKLKLKRGNFCDFDKNKIRRSLYRPFFKENLYFDRTLVDILSQFSKIFPTVESEKENFVICMTAVGNNKPFHCLMVNIIPDLHLTGDSQCFPFYTYNEDGTGRKENISDWALEQFRERYSVVGGRRSGVGGRESVVGSRWPGVSGRESVNEEKFLEKISEENGGKENQNLQGPGSVAGGNESCRDGISFDKIISERGDLRLNEPNSESSSINSGEFSRRPGEDIKEGVSLSLESSKGLIDRIGNSSDIISKVEISDERTNAGNMGENADSGQTSERPNPLPNQQPTTGSRQPTTGSRQPTPDNRPPITKWDIFYYIYGYLHNPEYRTKYAANLRRELPRIPFADDFWKYADAGKKLAELHVNYEQQQEYPLEKIENKDKPFSLRVDKMKLVKPVAGSRESGVGNRPPTTDHRLPTTDFLTIVYNDFLTLTGIPFEAFEYKLGNRSALEWIIDQYQVSTDKRSGITNDPNRQDEPDYILKLIGKIITVSLETVKIVGEM